MDFKSLKELNAVFPSELDKLAEALRIELRKAGELKPDQSKLSSNQISNLRERLGTWTVNGEVIDFSEVGGFNKYITGELDTIRVTPKALISENAPDPKAVVSRKTEETITDEEVGQSAARQLKKRIKVLDRLEELKDKFKNTKNKLGEKYTKPIVTEIQQILNKHGGGIQFNPEHIDNYGWGAIPKKDQNINGLNKYINASKRHVKSVIEEIEKLTGIKGDIGHGWAALGDKGQRAIYDKFGGMNVGGKYSAANIAFQPRFRVGETVKLAQLDHWFYNLLSANRPHEQGPTFSQLEDVYVGGQGWQRTLNDFIRQADRKLNEFGKRIIKGGDHFNFATDLTDMEKSLVLFGRHDTPEARLSQVLEFRDFAKSTGAQSNILEHLDDAGRYVAPTIESQQVKAQGAATKGQTLFGGPFKAAAVSTTLGALELLKGLPGQALEIGKGLAKSSLPDFRDALNPEHATNIAQFQNRVDAGEPWFPTLLDEGWDSAQTLGKDIKENALFASLFTLASKAPVGGGLAKGAGSLLSNPYVLGGTALVSGTIFATRYLEERYGEDAILDEEGVSDRIPKTTTTSITSDTQDEEDDRSPFGGSNYFGSGVWGAD